MSFEERLHFFFFFFFWEHVPALLTSSLHSNQVPACSIEKVLFLFWVRLFSENVQSRSSELTRRPEYFFMRHGVPRTSPQNESKDDGPCWFTIQDINEVPWNLHDCCWSQDLLPTANNVHISAGKGWHKCGQFTIEHAAQHLTTSSF